MKGLERELVYITFQYIFYRFNSLQSEITQTSLEGVKETLVVLVVVGHCVNTRCAERTRPATNSGTPSFKPCFHHVVFCRAGQCCVPPPPKSLLNQLGPLNLSAQIKLPTRNITRCVVTRTVGDMGTVVHLFVWLGVRTVRRSPG